MKKQTIRLASSQDIVELGRIIQSWLDANYQCQGNVIYNPKDECWYQLMIKTEEEFTLKLPEIKDGLKRVLEETPVPYTPGKVIPKESNTVAKVIIMHLIGLGSFVIIMYIFYILNLKGII